MNCSPYDLRDFFFGELSPEHRDVVEKHVAGCGDCRDELASISLTRSALLSVPEEEPPRRIAFVSNRLFEPRWWQRIWSSAPQLGFVSACLLAMAIVVHGFAARRDQPMVVSHVQATPVDKTAIESAVKAEFAQRFEAAVHQATVAAEQRQVSKLLEVVNDRIKGSERRMRSDILLIQDYLIHQQKQNAVKKHNAYYEELR